jgi:hypothetical protein
MNNIKPNQPIILGLAGKAGSGKTSVAEQIVPKGFIDAIQGSIRWDHLFYALPLYEMASIKKNTIGINEESRKLHALHEVLYDLYGGSAIGPMPHYNILVEKVKLINNLPIEKEGTKPRTFLQTAGDICREYDQNCFANWAIIKANKLYRQYVRRAEDTDNYADLLTPFGVIISDVRYLNEAKSILKQPNGFVLVFDADDEVLNERIMKRDGKLMSEDQSNHSSESEIEEIKKIATKTINTNSMTIEEQAQETLNLFIPMKEETNA